MDNLEITRIVLNTFELTAAVAGFLNWHKIKKTYWRWLPYLLAFIFITEIAAKLMRLEGTYKTTIPLLYKYLNIPVMIISLIWLMGKEFVKSKVYYLPFVFICVYLLAFISEELFFTETFSRFGTLSYQIGSVAMLILALFSFSQLMNNKNILHFKSNMHFWVALGVVLYLITTLPFMAFRNSLFKYNYSLGIQLWYITMVFNVIMYCCFAAGFVLFRANTTTENNQTNGVA